MTAPARSHKTLANSDTDTDVYTTASVTIAASALALVAVVSRDGEGNTVEPTIGGDCITLPNVIASVVFGTGSGVHHRLTLFTAVGTGNAGTIAISHSSGMWGCAWGVTEYSHAGGTPTTSQADDLTDSDFNSASTASLAGALRDADSVMYAAFAARSGVDFTASTNYTLDAEATGAGPGGALCVGGGGNVTSLAITTNYGEETGAVYCEVLAPVAGGGGGAAASRRRRGGY